MIWKYFQALFPVLLFFSAESSLAREITGVVQDSSQAAISGAAIAKVQKSSSESLSSNMQGAFAFHAFDNQPIVLTIKAPGFQVERREIPAGAVDIRLVIVLKPETVTSQIVVTASRTALPIGESPVSIQAIPAAQLQSSGALEVDDVLRQVAGFDLFRRTSSRTANPTTQGVSLRGVGSSGASRALILLDGVPVTDPFGGWMNWSQIPRQAIENVEMLRGGASDLYGGEALSGVVQMLTKTPEGTSADLNLSYGNESTPNASGYLGRDFGKWIASLAGEYFRTDGYIPLQASQRGAVDNPANSLHRNGELALQRQISQRSRFFIRGSGYDDSRHNGTIVEVNRTRAWQAVAGLDWETKPGELFQFRSYGGTEDFHQTFASVAANRATEALVRIQTVPSRDWGFSSQYSRPLTHKHNLLFGVDVNSVTGESDDESLTANRPSSLTNAGARDQSVGVFVQDIARITQRWLITPVIRFDDWRTVNGFTDTTALPSGIKVPVSFQDRSEQSFNPKLATNYRVSERLSLRASVYRSFRSPTLNELYRSFRLGNILTLANQQLRAERLTGWEGGPTESFFGGKLRLQQGIFWADVNRPIANVTQSVTPSLITRLRENLGSTRARGVEAEATVTALKWTEISAQYQFVDATVTAFPANASLNGKQVPEVAPHEFTFQIRYANPHVLTASVQARATSSAFDDDQNTLVLGSYFKLDAFVARRITPAVDFYVAAENLFDQTYPVARTPLTTLGPPLLARVGLQFHFRR
jgi:outer membrane receptor protein involved in Fe transport